MFYTSAARTKKRLTICTLSLLLGSLALFFGASQQGHAAGPAMLVKDVNPGPGSSYPTEPTNVNGTLFFTADDGTHGAQLWRSNGTTAGTMLVKSIFPGVNTASLYRLTN